MPPPGAVSSQQQQQLQPPPPQRSVTEAAGGRGGGNNNGAVGNIKFNQQVRVRIFTWRNLENYVHRTKKVNDFPAPIIPGQGEFSQWDSGFVQFTLSALNYEKLKKNYA
jgi:hypothetical protein